MDKIDVNYHFTHYQGDTFLFQFNYTNNDNIPIDLSGASAEMHIRKSPEANKLVAYVTDGYPEGVFGPTGGYDFEYGNGITGSTGGIILNYSGITGRVYIEIDADTMSRVPARRNFYELQVTLPIGDVTTILKGTFDLARETTR